MALLILFSILAVLAGFLFVSEATTGVAIIGIACWFGIMARLAQAETQHKRLMEAIEKGGQANPENVEAKPVATQ